MKNDIPVFGKFVRFIQTGEILKYKSYDPTNQMLEVELPQGGFSIVRRNEVDRILPNEELEYLQARKKDSN